MPEPDSWVGEFVGKAPEREPTAGAAGQTSSGITTSFARIEVVQPGGGGLARMKHLTGHQRVEPLTQHMQGSLGLGRGRAETVGVNVWLGSGSGIASTFEAGDGAEGKAAGASIKGATGQRAVDDTGVGLYDRTIDGCVRCPTCACDQ